MQDSIVRQFTTHLRQALAKAMQFATEFGHKQTTELHLLYGLAAEEGSISGELLEHAQLPVDLLKQDLIRRYHSPYFQEAKAVPEMSDRVITILTKAVRTAHAYGHTYIGTEHALASLLDEADPTLKEHFGIWQINLIELQRRLVTVLKSTSKFPDLAETIKLIPGSQEEGREEAPEFPSLQTLGREMTSPEYLANTTPFIGREKEVERLQHILGRRFKNNPLLIGKAGVGKTAIVEGLGRAIAAGTVPPFLQGKRLFSLELSSLVAGTMYRGDFEQRLRGLLDEIKADPDIIVFIDEIHTLVGAGASGQPLDAANILKPALARGDIRCIGATTWEEYQKHLAQDAALSRRFQTIMVEEPDVEQTRAVLNGVKPSFETFHNIVITDEAIEAALRLSERYLTHTCWPDKAIDALDEAASRLVQGSPVPTTEKKKRAIKEAIVGLEKQLKAALDQDEYQQAVTLREELDAQNLSFEALQKAKNKALKLKAEHVRAVVATRTGIPEQRLQLMNAPATNTLFELLSRDILGQEEALRTLASAIQRGYSPLKEMQKPMGAFLFLGPSGVGKTATAKAIAKHVFGDEKALTRLDMSEYAERFTSSKLVGAPAGYVGYNQSGTLTNSVRQRPLSVILFDEVEKAHPDIFNMLLQVLDEGVLLDGSGQRVDFRHSIIILTSNLGLNDLRHRVGFGAGDRGDEASQRKDVTAEAKSFFREEFLNRLDSIIHFSSLGLETRKAIIKQKIDRLQERLLSQVHFDASDEAITHLAQAFYKPEQGVRSLEQTIKEQIEYPLIELLPQRKPGSKLAIDIKDGQISLA